LQSCSRAPFEGQAPPQAAVWGLVTREYPDLARVLSPPR
jgi:hypothetical protein